VTRGIEIAVHWIGFNIDVTFWSQHISFYLVGCIVVTSIRGLLLTLTKVCKIYTTYNCNSSMHVYSHVLKFYKIIYVYMCADFTCDKHFQYYISKIIHVVKNTNLDFLLQHYQS